MLQMRRPLRRKKKAVHKVSTTDDKRLQATLKRLGVNTIPGIEEVNLFVDNDVIHFTNPKGEQLGFTSCLTPILMLLSGNLTPCLLIVLATVQCKHPLPPTPLWSAAPRRQEVSIPQPMPGHPVWR